MNRLLTHLALPVVLLAGFARPGYAQYGGPGFGQQQFGGGGRDDSTWRSARGHQKRPSALSE